MEEKRKPGRPFGTTKNFKKVYFHMYVDADMPEKIKAIGGAKVVRQLINDYYKMFTENTVIK